MKKVLFLILKHFRDEYDGGDEINVGDGTQKKKKKEINDV